MSENLIIKEISDGGLAVITLNDPEKRNAMGDDMAALFLSTVAELRSDKSVRAVMITGAGKAFSAGGNLDMLLAKTENSPEENKKGMRKFYDSFLSLIDIEVPVIAAINGHAIGAGLGISGIRNPHRTGGKCRGAADHRRFFQDYRAQAQKGRR